jgi:hypothetical protein
MLAQPTLIPFTELAVASTARGNWREQARSAGGPVLGSGTFATTFAGTWGGRAVAIKRLHVAPRTAAQLAAFTQEAAVLHRAGEANRNVARCLGVCTPTVAEVRDDDAAFCIVMEFVAGSTVEVAARTLVPPAERANFAARVGLTPHALKLAAQRGRLGARKIGRNWTTTAAELDAYQASRKHAGPGSAMTAGNGGRPIALEAAPTAKASAPRARKPKA